MLPILNSSCRFWPFGGHDFKRRLLWSICTHYRTRDYGLQSDSNRHRSESCHSLLGELHIQPYAYILVAISLPFYIRAVEVVSAHEGTLVRK